MCQAIKEMMEDSRIEGEKAGREEEQKEGIRIFIQSHRDDGTEEEVIADKLQKYYAKTAEDAWSLLNNSKNGQCP